MLAIMIPSSVANRVEFGLLTDELSELLSGLHRDLAQGAYPVASPLVRELAGLLDRRDEVLNGRFQRGGCRGAMGNSAHWMHMDEDACLCI